jgi:DNA-binding transcriptional ArsR family regulator
MKTITRLPLAQLSADETHVEIPGPTLSHHLDILRRAGLLESGKEERYIYHSVPRERITALVRRAGTRSRSSRGMSSSCPSGRQSTSRVRRAATSARHDRPRRRPSDWMGVNCCHANQDKFWVKDPDGVEREVYHLNYDLEGGEEERNRPVGRRQACRACPTQRLASDRRRGSSSSRRASPTRLTATTVSMMQKPGTEEIHHARRR